MKRQRALSIILALAFILPLLPAFALADEGISVLPAEEMGALAESVDVLSGAEIMETSETADADALETEDAAAENIEDSGDGEAALCGHGNAAADCAICAVEEQIDALPSAAETVALDAEGQDEIYIQASAVCEAYYALTEDEQAQVSNISNIETLFALLDYFSGGVMLLAEGDDDACTCGGTYDNGICTSCGAYQAAVLNESSCYEIGNAGQLFWFAELVNGGTAAADAVLTANIDLNPGYVFDASDGSYSGGDEPRSWTPVGTSSINYSGTFDGKGYTISGIYINSSASYQGLFGYIKDGTVCNVTVSNSSITGNQYVGGIIGYASGCTVSSCTNCGAVVGQSSNVGGIVGYITGTNGSITDCHNYGAVSGGSQSIGGIVGYAYSFSGDIANCSNRGTVSGSNLYVGGVVGYAYVKGTIVQCVNEGNVHGGNASVGGIVGYIGSKSSGSLSVCFNSGSISGNASIGGIVGQLYSSSNTFTVTDCFNGGSVSASESATNGYAGGIVGNLPSKGSVSNCCNVGAVSGYLAGGVVGHVSSGSVSNSYYLDTSADSGVGSDSTSTTMAKTAEEFASGEVTWLLNGGEDGVTDGTQIWYQTLGNDSAPSFSGGTVYYDGTGYSNSGGASGGTTVYSVEISWGNLAFTYQEAAGGAWNPETHEYGETTEADAWSCDENANLITVTNNSDAAVNAAVSYTAAEGYAGISAKFGGENSCTLKSSEEETFSMSLSGELNEETLENTTIGTVTVTITAGE